MTILNGLLLVTKQAISALPNNGLTIDAIKLSNNQNKHYIKTNNTIYGIMGKNRIQRSDKVQHINFVEQD